MVETVRTPGSKGALKMNLFKKFLSPWIRCWHLHRGPLISCRPGEAPSPVAALTGTYCVCLDCGQHFAYDWKTMKWVSPVEAMQAGEPMPVKMASASSESLFARKAS